MTSKTCGVGLGVLQRREYFRVLPNNLKMAEETTVLLVTDKPSLPGTVVMWAMQKFEDKAKGGKGMTVVTNILKAGQFIPPFLFLPLYLTPSFLMDQGLSIWTLGSRNRVQI